MVGTAYYGFNGKRENWATDKTKVGKICILNLLLIAKCINWTDIKIKPICTTLTITRHSRQDNNKVSN